LSKIKNQNKSFDKAIQIFNKLENINLNIFSISSPIIAVLGYHSSGKSSVIESLVGKDFLPKGRGIVTKLPLILHLNNSPQQTDGSENEWGIFLHTKKKFYDFNEIKKEIEEQTKRVTGSRHFYTFLPIHLKLFSPK
jgi:dynamin 1-like protein